MAFLTASSAFAQVAGGLQGLGGVSSNATDAFGVSSDGSVVVGQDCIGSDQYSCLFMPSSVAFWKQGEPVAIGATGNAFGVSADGSVIVGGAANPSNAGSYNAFRWTQSGGLQYLSASFPTGTSFAYATNVDGSIIVGSYDASYYGTGIAFRWTSATGIVALELAPGVYRIDRNFAFSSNARAVNSDGLSAIFQPPGFRRQCDGRKPTAWSGSAILFARLATVVPIRPASALQQRSAPTVLSLRAQAPIHPLRTNRLFAGRKRPA